MSLLASTGDVYDGINIDAEQLPTDAAEFAESLQHSLQEWRQIERKGIWLRVPIGLAHLVAVATQQGFYFHHAERDYVMLAQWLPESEDKLPANASHQVGVGAFVFDRQSQRVLMVQERSGPLHGKGVWKMPTGLAMQREDIGDAAEREVLEETGVKAKFRSVLALRQAHTALFGKSDIFAVIALEPEAGAMDNIAIQEDELVAAEWQSLAEFEANPFPKSIPLLGKIVERCLAYATGEYPGLTAEKFSATNRNHEDILIYGASERPTGEATAFFVTSGSFTIGRQTGKGVDIAIANDPSISRRHAEIAVGPLDVNGPLTVHSSFQLKDLSRFGTELNGKPIGSGNTVSVQHGYVVQFGHKTKLRVTWDQVVLCLPDASAGAQQQASTLGFYCRCRWNDACTHLATGGAAGGVSAATACAKAAGKPIVSTQWLDACVAAGQAAVKEMPPLCTLHVVQSQLPEHILRRLPPAEAAPAPSVTHTPLRDWTLVWPPGVQDAELQQAASLAGGANAVTGDPALSAMPQGRLLHVVPSEEEEAHGAALPPDRLSIAPECLLAAIIDGRAAALQALVQAPEAQAEQRPAGRTQQKQQSPMQPRKRAAGSALGGAAGKKPRRGRAARDNEAPGAEDAAFDAPSAELDPPRRGGGAAAGDASNGPEPMDTDVKVVFEPIVTKAAAVPAAARSSAAASPNFKCFRKQHAGDGRRPIIGFAAASYAQEVQAKDFLRAERQSGLQNKAADDLFAARMKSKKLGRK